MSESPEIRVGDWTARPTLNDIERNGRSVKVEPRAMEVLVYLASRAGEVVSADELIDSVWEGRVVGDGAIYQSINQLRQALGDDVRYIQTIRKRGYRLVAPVSTLEPKPNKYVAEVARRQLRGRMFGIAIAALLIIAFVVVVQNVPDEPASPSTEDRRSIAVLPFVNQSAAEENVEFFADGIHGDLLTQLAKISSLKVISRTSVMEYRDTQKNMREIGRELGVATILVGRVQRAGNAVRINVQLIDAGTDEHLWAELYDRELTAQHIFAIQSEMATSIAGVLQAMLLPEEVARLNELPTESTRAYNFYLIGNDYVRGTDNSTVYSNAAEMYQRAVDEDPEFALAWAALSRAHSGVYFFFVDRTEARREFARKAVERAFQLEPDLAEAHLAMGYYYYHGFRDYEKALQAWSLAEQGLSGDSRLYLARAYAYRRMGEWEHALTNMDRAIELDPRNIEQLSNQAFVYWSLHDYARAEQYFDRILEIVPEYRFAYEARAHILLNRDGDAAAAKAALDNAPMEITARSLRWTIALYERDHEAALNVLDGWDIDVAMGTGFWPKAWFYGLTYQLAGRLEFASPQFQAARARIERELKAKPDDPRLLIVLAEVLAQLGEREAAIVHARRVLELLPTSKDALIGPNFHFHVIRILVATGDYDSAIDELDAYLGTPGGFWSIEGLLPHPRLEPIRDDPRFQGLVEKYRRQ